MRVRRNSVRLKLVLPVASNDQDNPDAIKASIGSFTIMGIGHYCSTGTPICLRCWIGFENGTALNGIVFEGYQNGILNRSPHTRDLHPLNN